MKKELLNALEASATLILSLIGIIVIAVRKGWFKLSRRVLKPYFGIETGAYKRWWARRSKRNQELLDAEHASLQMA